MAMRYYGVQFAYGPGVVNHGIRGDFIYRFASRAARDAWVAERTGRAPLAASTRFVRRLVRADERGGNVWLYDAPVAGASYTIV